MVKGGVLFVTLQEFNSSKGDMSLDKITSTDMGYIFEELIRKFSESYDEQAGAHFTSRDIIYLMTELLIAPEKEQIAADGCIVDEFQHRMYQNPDLTPDERNAVWLELEHKYRPWIDFDNLPFYGRGAGWQRQLHIYECPFYYIDYCLSTMAALQFFLLSLKDHKDAWQRYLRLVRRAGMASYAELCETAGLKVPFTDGSIKAIAEEMEQWIAAHQV